MSTIQDFIKTRDLNGLKQALEEQPGAANQADQRGFTPLIFATYLEATEMVKILLENGANINAQDASGNTALMGVCFKGHLDIAKLLLEKGADLNIKNHSQGTALSFAVNYQQVEIARLLLNNGAEIGNSKDIFLQQARNHGNKSMEDLLLSYQ